MHQGHKSKRDLKTTLPGRHQEPRHECCAHTARTVKSAHSFSHGYLAFSSLCPKDSGEPAACGMEKGSVQAQFSFLLLWRDRNQNTHLVYVTNYIRLSYAEKVIIAFQRPGMIFKFMPSEILFRQGMLLDHGTHASIQNHYPLLQNWFNFIFHTFLEIRCKKINPVFQQLWNSLSIHLCNLSSFLFKKMNKITNPLLKSNSNWFISPTAPITWCQVTAASI